MKLKHRSEETPMNRYTWQRWRTRTYAPESELSSPMCVYFYRRYSYRGSDWSIYSTHAVRLLSSEWLTVLARPFWTVSTNLPIFMNRFMTQDQTLKGKWIECLGSLCKWWQMDGNKTSCANIDYDQWRFWRGLLATYNSLRPQESRSDVMNFWGN